MGKTSNVKTNLDLLEQEIWQWHLLCYMQVCTSSRTTTPTSHHSVFYRPDALPVAAAQPTASKHWMELEGAHRVHIYPPSGWSVVGGHAPLKTGLSAHRHTDTDTQKWKQYIRQFHSVHLADIIIHPMRICFAKVCSFLLRHSTADLCKVLYRFSNSVRSSVRLSVHLSVTRWHCVKTIIELTASQYLWTLVFSDAKTLDEIPMVIFGQYLAMSRNRYNQERSTVED